MTCSSLCLKCWNNLVFIQVKTFPVINCCLKCNPQLRISNFSSIKRTLPNRISHKYHTLKAGEINFWKSSEIRFTLQPYRAKCKSHLHKIITHRHFWKIISLTFLYTMDIQPLITDTALDVPLKNYVGPCNPEFVDKDLKNSNHISSCIQQSLPIITICL